MMSAFGELLKTLRKEKRVTQRQLADLVGIDYTYISKIESGAMDPPAEDKIVKIAKVLGEDPDRLILAAKKIPSNFHKVITEQEDVSYFLRKASRLTPDQWKRINEIIKDVKDE